MNAHESKYEKLFKGESVWRSIFAMAIPSLLTIVIMIFYNVADTFFIAQLGDTAKVASVSIIMPVFSIIMALATMIGVGGSAVIANAFGAGDTEKAMNTSSLCFYTAIAMGLIDSLRGEESFLARMRTSPTALAPLISYIGENRHFYRIYMRKYGGVPLAEQFNLFWKLRIVPYFRLQGIENETHMRYFFEYVKAGFMMVIGCWLEDGCKEPPEEIAEVLYKLMPARG